VSFQCQSIFSVFRNKFHFSDYPNQNYIPRIPSQFEGRIRIVRDAGRGAVDAGSVGRVDMVAGRVSEKPVSGQGAQTYGAEAYGKIVWA
jgi:hypothetical protein